MDYEIDPSKAQQGADMSANTANLLSIVEMFLAKITRSKFTNVPYPLRTLCRDLAEATSLSNIHLFNIVYYMQF